MLTKWIIFFAFVCMAYSQGDPCSQPGCAECPPAYNSDDYYLGTRSCMRCKPTYYQNETGEYSSYPPYCVPCPQGMFANNSHFTDLTSCQSMN